MPELVEKILAEIQSRGAISFRDFMQMALYCPVYGYYEKETDIIGASGDFFTSPTVGPLFGQLLAFQFSAWLSPDLDSNRNRNRNLNRNLNLAASASHHKSAESHAQIIEAGAHDGILARDILTWIQQQRPILFECLEYFIIEPSAFRRSRQQQTLAPFSPKVHWLDSLPAVVPAGIRNTQYAIRSTILFSNELLDAFPVHRLGWDAKNRKWFEWGVTGQRDRFVWAKLQDMTAAAASAQPNLPPELLEVLPDEFTTEICPSAADWWRQAAKAIGHEKLLTIDYGFENEEFFTPERASGTLRAYRHHLPASDVLEDPGEQDITAHVNFSILREVGERCGLVSEPLISQAQFLTQILAKASDPNSSFGNLSSEQTRQFQTLTHPDHLGRAFRVLIQTRL